MQRAISDQVLSAGVAPHRQPGLHVFKLVRETNGSKILSWVGEDRFTFPCVSVPLSDAASQGLFCFKCFKFKFLSTNVALL